MVVLVFLIGICGYDSGLHSETSIYAQNSYCTSVGRHHYFIYFLRHLLPGIGVAGGVRDGVGEGVAVGIAIVP